MRIEIIAWEKFNPRKDVKSASWFRMDNNFCTHPRLYDLTNDQKMVWVYLMCEAGKKNGPTIVINVKQIADCLRVTTDLVSDTLDFLAHEPEDPEENPFIKIHSKNRTIESDRTHPGNISDPYATDGRTDVTDGRTVSGEQSSPTPITLDQINDPPPKPKGKKDEPTEGTLVWAAYSEAYRYRYRIDPKRNAKVNANCKELAKRLGADDAVKVVQFYLSHNKSWYLQKSHDLGCCVYDAEALYTQMLTDNRVTNSQAQKIDKNAAQAEIFAKVTRELEEKYGGAP